LEADISGAYEVISPIRKCLQYSLNGANLPAYGTY
jgi:hypothetical protein